MDWKTRENELEEYYEQIFGANGEIPFSDFLVTIRQHGQIHLLEDLIPPEDLFMPGVHGYLHAVKVMIYTLYIGNYYHVSEKEMPILLVAAKYHDIGRKDDSDDFSHGYDSARWIEKNASEMSGTDKRIVCFLAEAHSCPDEMMETVRDMWGLQADSRYLLFAKIIKDADALDRYRLHMRALNPGFLRTEAAVKIIKAAFVFHQYVLMQWLMKNKPMYLFHTTFSENLTCLEPFENWDMYGEYRNKWVFASERVQNAVLFFLHGEQMMLYCFGYGKELYVLV
ncbi:MAG: HD domain-containing protein, partial [bacterium]|nr:HD domain-containing protein [bacterium]